MTHAMRLAPAPFAMIKSGHKKYELRLYDEKRRRIAVGDDILFTNTESGETLRVFVRGLTLFPDFAALYDALPLLECGYTEETLSAASPTDMEEYYSPEEIEAYGVIAIRLSLV